MGTKSIVFSLLFFQLVIPFLGNAGYGQGIEQTTIVVKVKKPLANGRYIAGELSSSQVNFNSIGVTNYRNIGNSSKKNESNKRFKQIADSSREVDFIYKIAVPTAEKQSMLVKLKQQSWVEYAEALHKYELLYLPNDTHVSAHWGHVNTQTYEAWDISQGDSSIVIGIVDSGVRTDHPSLNSQFYYNSIERYGLPGIDDDDNGFIDDSLGYNFAEMNTDVGDRFGHGTEVSGVAAARVNDAFGTFGTGHNTRFMPINIVHPSGFLTNVFEAILYAAENGCKIINVSLGRPGGGISQYEQDIINYVTNELDVLIVSAAGNTDGLIDFYPASYENVLSVAHSMQSDERFEGGSYSYFVDLLAPGHQVPTTSLTGSFDSYKSVTGSSYSAPFVAGVAGLLRAAFPNYKAVQIAEILRLTADEDVYELSGNQDFIEMLGKGRLNALNALQKANSLKAIRASNIKSNGTDDVLVVRGDSVDIETTFTNVLNPISSNAKVTLSSASPYVEILDSIFSIGALEELDSIKNTSTPFKVILSTQLPENTKVYFKLTFEDEGYTDYQYFCLQSDAIFDISKNDWKFSLQGNGRLGYARFGMNNFGLGLQWKGHQLLQDAGIIFGTDSLNMADAINIQDTDEDTDFSSFESIDLEENDSLLRVTEYFTTDTKFPQLHFQQQLNFKEGKEALELSYQIANVSEDTIENSSIGFFLNALVDEDTVNAASWDALYDFGYIFQDGIYFGVKQFDANAIAYNLDLLDTSFVNLRDDILDTEIYNLLFTDSTKSFNGSSEIVHINRKQLPVLMPEDTVNVNFLLVAGNSIEKLQKQFAQEALDINYFPYFSSVPIVSDTTLCFSDTVKITWDEGENYNYYLSEDGEEPFAHGETLEIIPTGDSLTIWISNHDKVFESEKVAVNLYFLSSVNNIDWELPEVVLAGESFSIISQNTESLNRFWDMGDGARYSNVDTIEHIFTSKGLYTVTLEVSNDISCTNVLTRDIVVLKKSSIPVIDDTISVCYGNALTIAPQNGTSFRFYRNDEMVSENIDYTISEVLSPFNLEISNTSDDVESDKKTVFIDVYPVPDLVSLSNMPDSLNLNDSPLIIEALYGNEWQWLASNGQSGNQKAFEFTSDTVGTITVELTVTDTFGCVYKEEANLFVWQTAVTSLSNKPFQDEFAVYPIPAKESLSVKLPFKNNKAVIELQTLKGKKVVVNITKLLDVYILDLQSVPSGIYLLKVSTGGTTFTEKILKE